MSTISPPRAPTSVSTAKRSGYLLLSLFFATIVLIVIVWWPLVEDYAGSWDPRYPWWIQVDWLLLGIFGVMTALIMVGADVRRDAQIVMVGLAGGLIIESWGTQTGLWTYFTAERPPLWIIPAWPVASLAIDRLARKADPLAQKLPSRPALVLYAITFGVFAVLMIDFVWPTRHLSLTLAALFLCGFLIATPRQIRSTLAIFFAGAGLGYFLELWGTTRACWTYYTLETPPLFAVLAHGMAAVAFWRTALLSTLLQARLSSLREMAARMRRRTAPTPLNPSPGE